MEVVTQFNAELKSILGFRPPISRAKMAIITKLAIKSAKLYKHVVMHVERFIAKCPPDFKVPGLYVIDSIVRQSQHQLGAEKDVFAPRFSRNFSKTFQQIFECTEEDKPKVVRVLNLWQKNGVFTPDVVQPLLSLAPASNGVSEQWQQSSAQPIPSSPGDQPLKGVGRVMTPQDNSSRDHRGFQDRQRSLPGQFDTPPGDAPPFGQASPPPPHMPNQQDPVMMMVPGERRYQTHEPAMEDTAPTPPPSHARGAAHLHTQQQQQMFDQALLNDFDYSDEDEDREGMRGQGQKGMLQADEASMPVEGMRPESDLDVTHQQGPTPAILTNDPSRFHLAAAGNVPQYPPPIHGPAQLQQQQQQPPQGGPPPNHAGPPQQGGFMPPPHMLPPPSQGYPPFQGGPPGYHGGPQPPFHGGPSSFHGGPPPRPQGGPPPPLGPHGGPPPSRGPHGGPLPPDPHNGPPPHGYGPPRGFPPPHGFPPSRGPPPSLGLPPHGQPRPLHGPPSNLPQSPNSPHPGFFPVGPSGPPNRDHHPQSINYGHRSLPPPPPPPHGSGPPQSFHHPPPSNPPPSHPPPSSRPERYPSPPYRGRTPSPPPQRRAWREREGGNSGREREGGNSGREREGGNSGREREGGNGRDRGERWMSPPRRRSRSPMREQKSRSPVRHRDSRGDSRSPPLRRKSADVDRHRKGGAHPREQHYTVCSTTIWVGHLPKNASQGQIADEFVEFGTVKSVDVVQARGCAYVVMPQRSEAARALNALKDLKLNGTACKLAWAPGRGVKGAAFKNYWDTDLGISFIPWEKIKSQEELDSVVEGGWIDPATCPPGMKPSTQTKGEATTKQDTSLPDSNNPLLPPGVPILPGQPVFPASGPPPGMAPPMQHLGMGTSPFGMGGVHTV